MNEPGPAKGKASICWPRLAGLPPYRRVIIFVDNAGADVVLGMLPFARELLRRGCEVVLAANSLPAINDVTATELRRLMVAACDADALLAVWMDGQTDRHSRRQRDGLAPCCLCCRTTHCRHAVARAFGGSVWLLPWRPRSGGWHARLASAVIWRVMSIAGMWHLPVHVPHPFERVLLPHRRRGAGGCQRRRPMATASRRTRGCPFACPPAIASLRWVLCRRRAMRCLRRAVAAAACLSISRTRRRRRRRRRAPQAACSGTLHRARPLRALGACCTQLAVWRAHPSVCLSICLFVLRVPLAAGGSWTCSFPLLRGSVCLSVCLPACPASGGRYTRLRVQC
jgi:Damage-control phosphatase ARMT1-like domain